MSFPSFSDSFEFTFDSLQFSSILSLLFLGVSLTPSVESFSKEASFLKVLNYNTWGLNWPWARDRELRFRALRSQILHNDYDIVLLQEVWFSRDYNILRGSMPYASSYKTLNSNCFGKILPIGCSGLAILSKHPIENIQLFPFSRRGNFWNFDGEVFVGKGVAKASIRWNGLLVDVFTTHLISYTSASSAGNSNIRASQTLQILSLIQSSRADIKIFGGDMNAAPSQIEGNRRRESAWRRRSRSRGDGLIIRQTLRRRRRHTFSPSFLKTERLRRREEENSLRLENSQRLSFRVPEPYALLRTVLFDSLLDKYPGGSLHPWFATFGNERNTYTRFLRPERIDYILYTMAPTIEMFTFDYKTPVFRTRTSKGSSISLSDHEAIVCIFIIEKRQSVETKSDEELNNSNSNELKQSSSSFSSFSIVSNLSDSSSFSSS